MQIVDAHFHVWDLDQVPQPWIDPQTMSTIHRSFDTAEYIQEAHAHAPTGCVVVGVLVQTVHHPQETARLLELAHESGHIGAVVGWADMLARDFSHRLNHLRGLPGGQYLKGLRYQIQEQEGNGALESEHFHNSLSELTDAGLTFDLIVRADQLEATFQSARRHPNQKFVIDHLGKPPLSTSQHAQTKTQQEQWAIHMKALAQLPNVYAKISGLHTLGNPSLWGTLKTQHALRNPFDGVENQEEGASKHRAHENTEITELVHSMNAAIQHALHWFGPQRLMFGSDWPVVNLSSSYWNWVNSVEQQLRELTPEEKDDVWWKTATGFYSLEHHNGDPGN